ILLTSRSRTSSIITYTTLLRSKMTFESTKIEGSGSKYQVTGNLTIKDVTKEITVPLSYNGQGVSPFGHTVYGFEADCSINSEDLGLTWYQTLDTCGVLVSIDDNIRYCVNNLV